MEIKFNFIMKRWEVFNDYSVIRAGERQPSFVSVSRADCVDYVKKVEDYHE